MRSFFIFIIAALVFTASASARSDIQSQIDSLRLEQSRDVRVALATSVDSSLGDSSRALGIRVLPSPRDHVYVMLEFPLGAERWQRKYLREVMARLLQQIGGIPEASTSIGTVDNGVHIMAKTAKRFLLKLEADIIRE